MSDSTEPTFKFDDLLISIVPARPPGATEIVSGTLAFQPPVITNVAATWPGNNVLVCGHDGQAASLAPHFSDPALLAGVKSLLRAQIAHLEAQTPAEIDNVLKPTTVAQAEALETSLSAALDEVRRLKAHLGAEPQT